MPRADPALVVSLPGVEDEDARLEVREGRYEPGLVVLLVLFCFLDTDGPGSVVNEFDRTVASPVMYSSR